MTDPDTDPDHDQRPVTLDGAILLAETDEVLGELRRLNERYPPDDSEVSEE